MMHVATENRPRLPTATENRPRDAGRRIEQGNCLKPRTFK